MIFPEAMQDLDQYRKFVAAVKVPVLANITEFGATPLFTTEQLRDTGVGLVLYPLSAFRAMNKAALAVYEAIRRDGTQQGVVDLMQTRMELYDFLGYHAYEQKLDDLAIREVLADRSGRRVLRRLLSFADPTAPTFHKEQAVSAFMEGRRSVGAALLAWISEAEPAKVSEILTEVFDVRRQDGEGRRGRRGSESESGSEPESGE